MLLKRYMSANEQILLIQCAMVKIKYLVNTSKTNKKQTDLLKLFYLHIVSENARLFCSFLLKFYKHNEKHIDF